ncbi:hypothetical protein CAP48_07985 [Advenella sp. S44]|nr:hypothetical protein CAP48_07985 [Advenella sp. S44]
MTWALSKNNPAVVLPVVGLSRRRQSHSEANCGYDSNRPLTDKKVLCLVIHIRLKHGAGDDELPADSRQAKSAVRCRR